MNKVYITTIFVENPMKSGKIKLYSETPEDAGKIKYYLEKGEDRTIERILSDYKNNILLTPNSQLFNLLKNKGFKVELTKKMINTLDAISSIKGEEALHYLIKLMETYTKERLKDEMTNKDMLIIHAINAYDEYTETINIFYERLREWYGIYFPELAQHVKKIDRYASIIKEFLTKENMTLDNLLAKGYPEERARNIEEAAKNSTGGMLTREDLEIIKSHAETLLQLIRERDKIDEYLKTLLEEEAPNTTYLIGHKLTARLIAKAGGLRKLATLPASTVQLLGAEKSLFIALRKGGKPPKHGIIFQHPFINQSPKVIRGRVARLLAGKITIAARVDAFGGDFIADRLLKEVEERVEELRRMAPTIQKKKRMERPKRKIKKKFKRKKR